MTCPKLHKIPKMTLTAATGNLVGVTSDDTAKQEREVLHEYSSKWGARDFNRRQEISGVLSRHEGDIFDIKPDAVHSAARRIKRACKIDHYGVCPLGISIFASAKPDVVCSFMSRLLASRSSMSSFSIQGRLYAKSRGAVAASKTRAILPLPSILSIFDCILCSYWEPVDEVSFFPLALPSNTLCSYSKAYLLCTFLQ